MINVLRKHQQVLMIVITILVIIAFVWLYNGRRFEGPVIHEEIGKIYGAPLTQTQVERQARRFQLCADLGYFEMIQSLAAAGGFDRTRMVESFIWNSMVLRHESDRLQIEPTDDEVAAEIQAARPFQTNGAFDSTKYNLFLQEKLAPRGFTVTDLEDVVRDQLRLRKIKSLVSSAVELSPTELRAAYQQQYQKIEASVIRLNGADFQKGVQIGDDDLKKAFEQRKSTLSSEEKRKVRLVKFEITDDEKKLKGKERIDALQKLANKANELTQAMLEKEAKFDDVAARMQVPVSVTGDFSPAVPDPALSTFPAVSASAFHLTKDDPNSDAIQTENGFYILHLESVTEAKPLTFEEAKPKLAEQLTQERARETLNLKATEIHNKIEADLKAGTSFAEAAAAAGQKVEKVPAFSPSETNQTEKTDVPDIAQIQGAAAQLTEGQLGPPVPAQDGMILIHVDKRLPIDEEKFTKEKEQFAKNYARGKRELVFQEWLRVRKNAARIDLVKS